MILISIVLFAKGIELLKMNLTRYLEFVDKTLRGCFRKGISTLGVCLCLFRHLIPSAAL